MLNSDKKCVPGTPFVYDVMRESLEKMDTPTMAPATTSDMAAQVPASLPPLSAGDTNERKVAVEGAQTAYHPVLVICLKGTRGNVQRFINVHMAEWGWQPNGGRTYDMQPMIGDLRPYLAKGVKFFYMHRMCQHVHVRVTTFVCRDKRYG